MALFALFVFARHRGKVDANRRRDGENSNREDDADDGGFGNEEDHRFFSARECYRKKEKEPSTISSSLGSNCQNLDFYARIAGISLFFEEVDAIIRAVASEVSLKVFHVFAGPSILQGKLS